MTNSDNNATINSENSTVLGTENTGNLNTSQQNQLYSTVSGSEFRAQFEQQLNSNVQTSPAEAAAAVLRTMDESLKNSSLTDAQLADVIFKNNGYRLQYEQQTIPEYLKYAKTYGISGFSDLSASDLSPASLGYLKTAVDSHLASRIAQAKSQANISSLMQEAQKLNASEDITSINVQNNSKFANSTDNFAKTKIVWPSKPHRNGTSGHWETIVTIVDELAQSGEYKIIYVNKGLRHEVFNASKNRRPDIMAVRLDGTIDQFEVLSKTDKFSTINERIDDNARILGDRAGPKRKAIEITKYWRERK